MNPSIIRHCRELSRCNQRGGRMLSVFDLIEAGTLDYDLAAYLMTRISRRASFMVGAAPGGAGKTTVMCALANFVPAGMELVAATSESVAKALSDDGGSANRCYVCHEMSSGFYFSYLWGADLRAYCSLAEKGYMLATNLHADDVDEAHDQICCRNGVPENGFCAFQLLVFLRNGGRFSNPRRRIDKVYSSDGKSPHTLVFDARKRLLSPQSSDADDELAGRCREFLEKAYRAGTRTIEDAREQVLAFFRT